MSRLSATLSLQLVYTRYTQNLCRHSARRYVSCLRYHVTVTASAYMPARVFYNDRQFVLFCSFFLSFHLSSSPFISSRPSSTNSDPGVVSPVPTSVREFHLHCEKTSIQPFPPSSTRVELYLLEPAVDITLPNIDPPIRHDICI